MLNAMTEQLTNSRVTIMNLWFGVYVLAITVVLGNCYNFISSAKAQTGPIKVDLGIIQNGGVYGYGPAYQTKLKIPPKSNPISQLHIAPQKSYRLDVPTPKKSLRNIQPKSIKKSMKAATAPLAPTLVKPLNAPTPTSLPVKKVQKVLLAPAPVSEPKPLLLRKNKKTASKFTSEPVLEVVVPSMPPMPPKLTATPETKVTRRQANKPKPSVKIETGQTIQIRFEESATKIPENMKDQLRNLADVLQGKKELWLRLKAYANEEGMTSSKARRLSLSRALSVRSFLIESGVQSTRIGVRALGNKALDTPKNRVDISIAKR